MDEVITLKMNKMPLNKKNLNLIIIQIYLIKFCQLFVEDQDVGVLNDSKFFGL